MRTNSASLYKRLFSSVDSSVELICTGLRRKVRFVNVERTAGRRGEEAVRRSSGTYFWGPVVAARDSFRVPPPFRVASRTRFLFRSSCTRRARFSGRMLVFGIVMDVVADPSN